MKHLIWVNALKRYRTFVRPLHRTSWSKHKLRRHTRYLHVQYIPRNMHTVFALLCFVVVIHWLIFPYPSGLLRWHCGNLTIAPVPAKQPWWIWINTSCEFIMNDCITTTKQSTTKPCAYFLGYTVKLTTAYISQDCHFGFSYNLMYNRFCVYSKSIARTNRHIDVFQHY